MGNVSEKLIANNKKAYHDYFIEDKYEAGIALAGTEVKALRMGKCSNSNQPLFCCPQPCPAATLFIGTQCHLHLPSMIF